MMYYFIATYVQMHLQWQDLNCCFAMTRYIQKVKNRELAENGKNPYFAIFIEHVNENVKGLLQTVYTSLRESEEDIYLTFNFLTFLKLFWNLDSYKQMAKGKRKSRKSKRKCLQFVQNLPLIQIFY